MLSNHTQPELTYPVFTDPHVASRAITRQLVAVLKGLDLPDTCISDAVWLAFNSALQVRPPVPGKTIILGLEQVYGLVFSRFPCVQTSEGEIVALESIICEELRKVGIHVDF